MKGHDRIPRGTWNRKRRKRLYLSLIPQIRDIARTCGYAIGVHGSLTRDLDLIAAPWSRRCVTPLTLAMRIQDQVSGSFKYGRADMWKHRRTEKPHGRLAFVIMTKHFGSGAYIDLSIMPRQL